MKRPSPGTMGWIAVGAAVVAADLLDEKTMSHAFRTASRHPVAGPAVFVAWGVLTAHLFGLFPPNRDPLFVPWEKVRLRVCPATGTP